MVEAKPEGRTLTGMVEQAETSMQRLPDNQRLTLKQNPLRREHVDDFVACFGRDARQGREGTDRFRRFAYADLLKRDRLNLDLAWLKDDSPEDTSNLPPPGAIAAEIVENLEAALARFRQVAEALAGPDMPTPLAD